MAVTWAFGCLTVLDVARNLWSLAASNLAGHRMRLYHAVVQSG